MFPKKTKFLRRPIGWEDLGEMEEITEVVGGNNYTTVKSHDFCNTTVRIGRENGEMFRYCPRCMVKTKQLT